MGINGKANPLVCVCVNKENSIYLEKILQIGGIHTEGEENIAEILGHVLLRILPIKLCWASLGLVRPRRILETISQTNFCKNSRSTLA